MECTVKMSGEKTSVGGCKDGLDVRTVEEDDSYGRTMRTVGKTKETRTCQTNHEADGTRAGMLKSTRRVPGWLGYNRLVYIQYQASIIARSFTLVITNM